MAPRSRWALLAVLFAVLAITVVVAGRQSEPPTAAAGERLGPEPGDLVTDYLRRAAGSLPPADGREVWALVQLDGYLDPAAAAGLLHGVRLSAAVLRVPLPGVQTALVFRDLPGQHPAAELASAAWAAGQERARAGAQALPGSRSAAVAAAEAARLRAGCACVLALLVQADGHVLHELAGRPGVRAVHAADPAAPRQDLSMSPLLPEQREVVAPVADDGPVPG